MTDFSAVSLRIETVGGREAFAALDDLDKKGRRVVENAAGALGRAMGDVAVAYEKGSVKMRRALEDVADAHRANMREMEAEQRAAVRAMRNAEAAAERLSERQAHAVASASRGLEMLGRTGRLTGRSLDAVLGQASALAFAFGPAGQVVTAISIATAAVVEMFMRTSKEAKKLAEEAAKEFERISDLDTKGQGEKASWLYSGKWNAANPLDRLSLPQLRARQAELQRTIANPGTTTVTDFSTGIASEVTDIGAQREAARALEEVNAALAKREEMLKKITGAGGSLEHAGREQAAADLPGFITDQIKENEANAKKAAAAWNKAVKEFARGIDERKKAFDQLVGAEVARLTNADDPNISSTERLERANRRMDAAAGGPAGLPDLKQLHEQVKGMMHEDHFFISETVAKQIKDDPLLKFNKAVKDLAKKMHQELQHTLGNALSAGFEAAFTGKGISGAFDALTSTVLAGLGGFMEQLGAQMIIVGLALDGLASALLSLNGPAAIAAGVALVAAGAGLKAIAGSFGHGSGGGGGGYSGGYGSMPQIVDRGIINPGAYSSSDPRGIPNKAIVQLNATIFGTNDANAQRGFDEMLRKSTQRGSLAGAGA